MVVPAITAIESGLEMSKLDGNDVKTAVGAVQGKLVLGNDTATTVWACLKAEILEKDKHVTKFCLMVLHSFWLEMLNKYRAQRLRRC